MAANRYLALDGLRGIAAVLVLVTHTEAMWGFKIPRAYLGVDLFFLLSGFVIAHAYGASLANGSMSYRRFVGVRVLRLYPVYFISLLAAALAWYLFRPDAGAVGFLLAAGLFLLPFGLPGNASLFVLNGPYWSLFFELASNLLYGLVHRHLSRRRLLALVTLLALALSFGAYKMGSLNAGNLRNNGHLFTGFVRAHFGFFLGVLLYQTKDGWAAWVPRIPFWLPATGLALLFFIPRAAGLDVVIDSVAVIAVIPALVMVATTATTSSRTGVVLVLLGAASYPMYVLHIPLRQLVAFSVGGGETVTALAPAIGVVFVAGVFAISALIDRRVDAPFRRWFMSRVMGKRPVGPTAASAP